MPGFANIAEYASADESGRSWITQFRKAFTSSSTVTNSYADYSYFAGSPLANFYASTPLEAAYLPASRGIYVPSVAPYKQFVKSLTVMSAASSATSTTNQRQELMLCDYLMYYPFVDGDSSDRQDMVQAVSLPRYSSGQVMAISQSATASIGEFTFTYTNQDGTPGRVSPAIFTQVLNSGGQSMTAHISAGGFHPFLPLQAGDSGVKSIESVTFSALAGGLMALVIVKPIQTLFLAAECRRTTSGNLESYGAASEVLSVVHRAGAPEIKDGAVLNFITKGNGGALSSSILVGILETTWS